MPIRMPSPEQVGLSAPTAETPISSYQGGVAAQGAIAVGQAVQRGGLEINQTGQAFQQAQDLSQVAGANSNFLQKKVQLDQQFASDTDYTTSPQRYSEALTGVLNDAANGIQNDQAREQFLNSTRFMRAMGINRITYQAHTRAVQADQGYIKNNFDSTLTNLQQTPDQTTRVGLIGAFDTSVNAMVAKGSLTPASAVQYKTQLRQQYALAKAKTIIDTNPALGARLLAPGAPAFPAGVSPDLGVAIDGASSTYDVPSDWLAKTAQIESTGGRETGPSRAGASGDFGLMPAVAVQYGADPNNPNQAAAATAQLYQHNLPVLQQALGRAPTGSEMYLAHQQGAAGAAALLTHPGENAVDALAPFYGSPAAARSAIVDNGGSANMTAGDFTKMWTSRWALAPGAPGPHPNITAGATDAQGAQLFPKTGDWRDFLPPDKRADLARTGVVYSEQQVQANLADTERQTIVAQRQAQLQSQQLQERVIGDVMGVGPDKGITAADIANPAGPFAALGPEGTMRMLDFYKRNAASAADQHDTATYGPGFYKLFRQVNAPVGDPTRITDPSTLIDATGPGRDLTLAGLHQLQSTLKQRNTPDGNADSKMIAGALAYAKHELSFSADYGAYKVRDPAGENAFDVGFTPAFFHAYDAGIKAGKTPYDLLSKDSPDFIVDKIAAAYKRTPAQVVQDQLKAGLTEPLPTPGPKLDLDSQGGILSALHAGRLTRAAAMQMLITKGFAIANAPQVSH
ncbi:MAG: hypothetical protein ACREDC_00120 [Bradyrhizobium sp.]